MVPMPAQAWFYLLGGNLLSGSAYVSTTTGTPTCCATGVQMSASTVDVSIDTTMAYRAPFELRSRFG